MRSGADTIRCTRSAPPLPMRVSSAPRPGHMPTVRRRCSFCSTATTARSERSAKPSRSCSCGPGAICGLATKVLATEGASDMALIGTGKQAMTQLAAVAAVRPLRRVRAFSRDGAARADFVARAKKALGLNVEEASSVAQAVDNAAIVTLVTRATKPILASSMLAAGTHVNAVGAISPERTEFEPALLSRCAAVVADSVPQVQNLSSEFMQYYGRDEAKWRAVRALSAVVSEGRGRSAGADLTLFKAMGMGISDLALGIEILRRASEQRLGREFPHPQPVKLFA